MHMDVDDALKGLCAEDQAEEKQENYRSLTVVLGMVESQCWSPR